MSSAHRNNRIDNLFFPTMGWKAVNNEYFV